MNEQNLAKIENNDNLTFRCETKEKKTIKGRNEKMKNLNLEKTIFISSIQKIIYTNIYAYGYEQTKINIFKTKPPLP